MKYSNILLIFIFFICTNNYAQEKDTTITNLEESTCVVAVNFLKIQGLGKVAKSSFGKVSEAALRVGCENLLPQPARPVMPAKRPN